MSKRHDSRKWHQQKRWIIGSLFVFPPLGIPLLWLTRWPHIGKIGGSVFSGLILLSALTGESHQPIVTNIEPPALETAAVAIPIEPVVSSVYTNAIAAAAAVTDNLAVAESSSDWARIAGQWQSAISLLEDIPLSSEDYNPAQVKIAEYESNYDDAIAQRDAIEAEAIAQQQAVLEQAAVQQEIAATQPQPQPFLSVIEVEGRYVSGSCRALAARGVGSNFRPGDANYTSARDRDNDGVACES